MKKFNFILAALVMLAAGGCSKQEFKEAVQQNNTRIITINASLPSVDSQTRTTLAQDGEGLVMKWENTDKLYLNFKYGGNFYRADAPIKAASISSDKRQASFTVTLPSAIPDGAAFDLYGVYQKESTWGENDGGYFEKGKNNNVYVFENGEEQCITLDKMGTTQSGIARPAVTFKQIGITATSMAPIVFEHLGWMMALHFKNDSGAQIDLPGNLNFIYVGESSTSFIYNDFHSSKNISIDLSSGLVSKGSTEWGKKAYVRFTINDYSFNWLPLYGEKLGAGETIVLYRWLISTPNIDKMYGDGYISGNFILTDSSPDGKYLPAKTVEKGKVYHTYMTWNGTHLKITDRNGTPMP